MMEPNSRFEVSHPDSGYLEQDQYMNKLVEWADATFPSYALVERHERNIRLQLGEQIVDGEGKTTPAALSLIFSSMEAQKEALHIMDYGISQTTLEQIFNQFAAQRARMPPASYL